ncbi:MAG: tetratricopeptide repeat protein [Thermoanaerobaculia bacterium]
MRRPRFGSAASLLALALAAGCAPAPAPRAAQPAPVTAAEPEAVSLFGKPLFAPPLSPERRKEFEARLSEARSRYEANPSDPDAILWLGRRTAYLGRYREAIAIFTAGLEEYPADPRFYRHRGHRYLTTRRFDLAAADLEKAAALAAGKPDEIEPDGLPNARNIPTSTTNSNIWYHLGLARYLQGDFEGALAAYRECLSFSKNPDGLVSTSHWLYMTLRRLDREAEARRVLEPIVEGMDVIENDDYERLLRMYQGKVSPESLLEEASASGSALGLATVGYGVGNWYLYNGRRQEAFATFRRILEGGQWPSFGYIAAEADSKRLGLRP